MLVLSRRAGEAITIQTQGGDIQIVIDQVRRNGDVRMAFDCPPCFLIRRNELLHDGDPRLHVGRDRQEGDREEGEDLPSQERGASEDPGASL